MRVQRGWFRGRGDFGNIGTEVFEMKEIKNGKALGQNFNDQFRAIKMSEDKESMNYDSLGDLKKEDDNQETRLYRKYIVR